MMVGSAAMVSMDDLLTDAAAGASIRRYLHDRGIKTVATLALLARDEAQMETVLVDPLLNNWTCEDTTVIALTASEKPIAQAILRHLWCEANAAWQRQLAQHRQALQSPSAPAAQAAPLNSTASTEDKVPKQLPQGVWSALLKEYQSKQIDNEDRVFPVAELLGAEKVLQQELRTDSSRRAGGSPHVQRIGRTQPSTEKGSDWDHSDSFR